MKKYLLIGMGALVAFIVFVGISLIVSYNNLVALDEEINSAYGQIDVRLQQRHDEIGQLLGTIEGLQEHAENIYNAIVAARQAYADAIASGNIEDIVAADAAEAVALTNVLLVVEDNPLISAMSGYQALIDDIESLESALAVARKDYNDAVQAFNTKARRFPTVLFVTAFGFEKQLEYWKLNEGAEDVPVIDFGD